MIKALLCTNQICIPTGYFLDMKSAILRRILMKALHYIRDIG